LPERAIDGRDIWPLLTARRGARSPHDALYFYWGGELHAVRSGKWKLHLPHASKEVVEPGKGGRPGRANPIKVELSLYDLERDAGETADVAGENPEVVKRLLELAERAREDLGDALTQREGRQARAAGKLE
jgi:arylsulfatase A